ncbi:hypothetical protein SAMN05216587_1133 [Selenomonas ruminantium]|uniref:Uncharacterized protein n=1 Tax=Selenomonas ruminantium TaxID=971 RepID=A0A1I0YHT8_SELRU|nr:hypothetical protein SAMN05216587_1133 [Selenomonas ruminantium]
MKMNSCLYKVRYRQDFCGGGRSILVGINIGLAVIEDGEDGGETYLLGKTL